MKKGVIKATVLIGLFFAAVFVFSFITNQTNEDLTTEMEDATLPMMYLYIGDTKVNELHGYVNEMDASYMRDTITPVGTSMKIPAVVQTYGAKIDAISYKIRSIDGKDLIADSDITDYDEEEGKIAIEIPIQNLIKEEQEYNQILELTSGDNIYYYYT